MPRLSTAVALGIGTALVLIAGLALWGPTGGRRPDATGDAGIVLVYGQTPAGPVRLVPGEVRTLTRPQDLAFQFSCDGTGPRVIRIEVAYDEVRDLMHEDKLRGPAEMEALEYLLRLDDRAPNELTIITTIESPHDRPRVLEHRIKLTGRSP